MAKIDRYKMLIQNIYQHNILNSGYGFYANLSKKKSNDTHHLIYEKVNSKLKEIEESDQAFTSFSIIANKLEQFSMAEAQKEQAFLRTLPGFEDVVINYADSQSTREILKSLNEILGTRKEVERVAALVQNNSKTARDVTKYAIRYIKQESSGGYIQKALKDNSEVLMNSKFYQAIVNFLINENSFSEIEQVYRKWFVDSVSIGVTKMLQAGIEKKEEEEEKQTYSELLKKLEENDGKLKSVFAEQCSEAIGLNNLIENLRKYIKGFKKNKKDFDIGNITNIVNDSIKSLSGNAKGATGNLREVLETTVVNVLGGKDISNKDFDIHFFAERVGQQLFKTDVYIGYNLDLNKVIKNIDLDQKNENGEQKSVRRLAWEYSQKVQEKLKLFPEGFLLEENVKSYEQKTLKMNKKDAYGFNAGSYTGTEGLNLLYDIHANDGDILEIYNTIIQLGSEMIGEGREDVKKSIQVRLAQDIGHALFDDHENIGVEPVPESGQVLHILLLNTTRIFLSFFYYLLAQAFLRLGQDMSTNHDIIKEYVSVIIEPAGANVSLAKDGTQASDWEAQKSYSRDNTNIEMHFLHNFNEVVEQYLYG